MIKIPRCQQNPTESATTPCEGGGTAPATEDKAPSHLDLLAPRSAPHTPVAQFSHTAVIANALAQPAASPSLRRPEAIQSQTGRSSAPEFAAAALALMDQLPDGIPIALLDLNRVSQPISAEDIAATIEDINHALDAAKTGFTGEEPLAGEGLAYFQVASAICRQIASVYLNMAKLNGWYVTADNIGPLINKIKQFKTTHVPQDEYAVEALSAYCADLIHFATKQSPVQQLVVASSTYQVLRDSPEFCFLAASPLARYYLANVYLDNKDDILRNSGLAYVQATYVIKALAYENQGLAVSAEESAPWWDAKLSAAPGAAVQTLHKPIPRFDTLGQTFCIEPETYRRLGLGGAPKNKAFKAVTGLETQTTYLLTAHAETFSVAYRLTQLMGPESAGAEGETSAGTPCDVRDRCLPQRALARAQQLQDKLKKMRRFAQAAPELESQLAGLKSKLLAMDTQAKAQDEVADLVAYLLRQDANIIEANRNLRHWHAQADAALEPVQRQEILASLLADEQAEQTDQAAKPAGQVGKKRKKPKKKAPAKASTSLAAPAELENEVHAPACADPARAQQQAPVAAADSLPAGPQSAGNPIWAAAGPVPKLSAWQPTLNLLSDDAGPHTPAQLYELFKTVVHHPNVGKALSAERRQVEGLSFQSHLPAAVLRAMLVPFVDPGSFGRGEQIGTNKFLGLARSLHYHYNEHVTKKANWWPLGLRTPVEDYLDQALAFSSRVQRAIPKTSTADPSETIWKKYDNHFFGLFSRQNKLISFGFKG